jgi:hypothetical protein
MSISQRRITDHDSFLSAVESPRDAAALYFHKQIDPFYGVAFEVARDFFARPQLYTRINPPGGGKEERDDGADGEEKADVDVVRTLAKLRARCGSDELLPSKSQRLEIYSPIFGAPGDSASFDKLRDDLIDAATAFAERVFDTGVEMLRERVRTAHRPLKDYLLGLTGASTIWSVSGPLEGISEDSAFQILRDQGICSVFGILTAPNATWPYLEDSNADKLLEESTSKIDPSNSLTRQQASTRQRLAVRGAEAIAAVIDYTENSGNIDDDVASLNVLITTCYTWGAAKKAMQNSG